MDRRVDLVVSQSAEGVLCGFGTLTVRLRLTVKRNAFVKSTKSTSLDALAMHPSFSVSQTGGSSVRANSV